MYPSAERNARKGTLALHKTLIPINKVPNETGPMNLESSNMEYLHIHALHM